ncbi:hypothetical protein [Prochlorococcus sp. MIT 0916]
MHKSNVLIPLYRGVSKDVLQSLVVVHRAKV